MSVSRFPVPTYRQTEERRKARLLRILLVSFGTFVAVGLTISLLRSLSPMIVVAQSALLLVLALCYGLLRWGQLCLASILFVGGWVMLVIGSLLVPDVPAIMFLVIPYILLPATIAAGMLFTPRSSFVMATVAVVLLLLVVALRGGWSVASLPEIKGSEVLYISIPMVLNYVLAALSWLFGRDMAQAIHQSEETAQALAAQLTANKSLIVEMTETALRLAPTAEQLSAMMEQMGVSFEQVAVTVGQMAQGAASQAQRAEDASRSVAQLGVATGHIAANAYQTNDASTQAQKLVQDSAQEMVALGDKLSEIERMVSLVAKIADQTNLLSLNASIEAARAGEHGAGFAVVADEVRRLADHSAGSAGEVAALSQDIGVRLETVLAAMEETQRAVEQTATLAQGTAAATKEQEEASRTMVGAVNEMATVAEQSAAASEEVAASVEEQVVSLEQVGHFTQTLSEMASNLRQTVAEFATGSGSICVHFAACPIFGRSATDESMDAYVSQYCEGDFDECARKKLKEAGQPVPLSLLPDGGQLE